MDGENLFYNDSDPVKLSQLAYQFVSGQLLHAKALSAVLAPTVNSYKRLVPGYEAPVYIGDNSPHNYYFDAPSVMFGASLDYKTPSSPTLYRAFNGTLSGMKIRLGTDVDDTLNCEKP